MRFAPVLLAASLAAPAVLGGASRPDILLITVDTLRADHLGAYGYFRETSPAIDALAAESLLFERCYTPLAYTLPAHMSLLTATFPYEHGVLANFRKEGVYFDRAAGAASFAEFARRAGYTTAGFVSAAVLHRDTGIAAGFDVFYDVPDQVRAADTIERVLTFLDAEPSRPLFLWVHLYDPHRPYVAPPPFDRRFTTSARLEREAAKRKVSAGKVKAQNGELRRFEGLPAINAYDGEVAYADSQLGRLFEALRREGLWDDLVVVFTSDHGEALGEHGRDGHGHIYIEHLHVPLLVRVPGVAPRRVKTPVSLVDALPTALARIEGNPFARFLARVSGRDALGGKPRTVVISQRAQSSGDVPRSLAATGRYWAYLKQRTGREELFRLLDDPFELHDLSRAAPAQLRRMRSYLEAEIAAQEERARALSKAGWRKGKRVLPGKLERLHALGYGD